MTAIVGIRCTDGVVIGTDSAVTFASDPNRPTIEQTTEKLDVIDDRVIVATTGWVGQGQRFRAVIRDHCDKDFYKQSGVSGLDVGRSFAANAIKDFKQTGAPQGRFGALVAYPCQKTIHLCEFDSKHFQPELKPLDGIWYVSMGSSQPITDSFLGFIRDVFWHEGPPTIQQARFALTWTLDHAIKVNPGGVKGPISVGVLKENVESGFPRARKLEDHELTEIRVSIDAAKDALSEFPGRLSAEAAGERDVPEPDAGE